MIDISDISFKKIKDKLKRKVKALYRWKIKKKAFFDGTLRAYTRFLNKKFYENDISGELTWCRWYFPVINTADTLRLIDDYAVDCIRFLKYGNYGKKRYNLRYDEITKLGFKSLVNAYYNGIK